MSDSEAVSESVSEAVSGSGSASGLGLGSGSGSGRGCGYVGAVLGKWGVQWTWRAPFCTEHRPEAAQEPRKRALLRGGPGHEGWARPGKLGGGRGRCNVLGAHELDRPSTDGGGQGWGMRWGMVVLEAYLDCPGFGEEDEA